MRLRRNKRGAMGNRTDIAVEKLDAFVRRWLAENPGWQWDRTSASWPPRARDAFDLAMQLLAEAEFAEVGIAGWFGTPDGVLVRAVVSRILPSPLSFEVSLLAEAITIAAAAQQQDRQNRLVAAGATLVVVGLAASLLYALVSGGGQRRTA
jgi:hypothetical protein